MNKKPIVIFLLTIAIVLLCYFAGLNASQIVSTAIFSLFIFSTLLYWRFRLAFAFLGIVGLFSTGVLDVKHFIEFANFDIILFLVGMMTAIGFLEKRNFFGYVMGNVLKVLGPRPRILMFTIMLMSGLFGALVDEVTSILFMTSIMMHLVKKYKLRPLPFILMIVFATNIGSSATVVGNPIGVLIAFRGGFSFMDFIRWATPISIIVLLGCILICLILFSKDIRFLGKHLANTTFKNVGDEYNKKDIIVSVIFLIVTLSMLIFHKPIEEIFNLQRNTMLLGASFLAAGLALLIDRKDAKSLFGTSVDWWTLTFFLFFFASIGSLKFVGTIDIVGKGMIELSQGSEKMLFGIFTTATALLTPVIDNVLVVAVFIPIVESLGSIGFNSFPVWWGILFAGTLFGNLTMIGSTANIVAVGMLEARGVEVNLKDWIVPGIIVSVPTLLLAILLLYLQFPLMPK